MLLRTIIAAIYIGGSIWLVATERATGFAAWIVAAIGVIVLFTIIDNYRRLRSR